MKIVVNRNKCGFGLSVKAQREIHKQGGCCHQKVMTMSEYFGNGNKDKESVKSHLKMCEVPCISGNVLSDTHREYDARTCQKLIDVVEKLGKQANGKLAGLEIIDIPGHVDFMIEDYDGYETIHEKHRSW